MRTRLTIPLSPESPAGGARRGTGSPGGPRDRRHTERPLSAAQVTLTTFDGRALERTETDDTGEFAFEVKGPHLRRPPPGPRISYTPNTTPVLHFDDHSFLQLEVRLDPEAILLATLEVVAWSKVEASPLLTNFKRRGRDGERVLHHAGGRGGPQPDVHDRSPARRPRADGTGSGTGLRPVVQVAGARRPTTSDCPTQIWIDGFLLNRRRPEGPAPEDFRIDDAVAPSPIEGIEIYKGLGGVPAEFLNDDAKCGVIAIWTRRGGRVGRGPSVATGSRRYAPSRVSRRSGPWSTR